MKLRLCLGIALLCLTTSAFAAPSLYAASCSTTSSYGTADASIGTLPHTGTYTMWMRMQAADSSSNRVQVEVNKDTCFTVGGDGVSPSQWEWVNFQNGDRNNVVTFNFIKTSGNAIKLVGLDPGVKIDAMLLVADACVPVDSGDNCRSATSVLPSDTSSTLSPGPAAPVSGVVLLVDQRSDGSEISKLEYSVNGKKIQSSVGLVGLDTTLLNNGTNSVTTKITFSDGTTSSQVTDITVDNDDSFITPVYRWMRLNKAPLKLVGIVLGLVSLLSISFVVFRSLQARNQFLKTHGY